MRVLAPSLDKLLDVFPAQQKEIDRALRNAINTTLTKARRFCVDRIKQTTRLDPKRIDNAITAVKTTQTEMNGFIKADKKAITFTSYNLPISGSGVRGTVLPNASLLGVRAKGILFANLVSKLRARTGAPFVWARSGKTSYPIYLPLGPSMAEQVMSFGTELADYANQALVPAFEYKLGDQIYKRENK